MLLSLARGCWALSFLLLAGACQRAGYSFQPAPATVLSALPPAPALTLPAAASPRWRAPARARRKWPPRRPEAAVAHAPHTLCRVVKAVRATQALVRQQPLPADEPVHRRSRGIALLLAVVPLSLGIPLGLHYFYLGYPGRGALTIGLLAAAFVLLALGIIAFIGAIFGGGSAFVALYIAGAVILGVLYTLQLVDVVRIVTGSLLPRNGEYYPRLFQTRPAAGPGPPAR